jgi:membrane protease YdiL (CAAX protease family)
MKNKLELMLLIGLLLLVIFGEDAGMLLSFAIVILYLLIGKSRKEKFNSIGFKKPANWGKLLLTTFLIGLAIEMSFQILINPIIESLTKSSIDLSVFAGIKGNLPTYLIYVLIGFVIGGLLEEMLFRGFLLTRVASFFKSEKTGYTLGIIILSILFGLAHMYQGWSGVLNTGLTSVLLGLVFIKFDKNLWYAIFTHGFIDFVGFTVLYLGITEKLQSLFF